jgi:sugar/nucleoside kinase (ribokinase family)
MKRILGLGNALVDIISPIEDESLLIQLNLPKGSMQLVDNQMNQLVIQHTTHLNRTITAGGSAANTIKGLAALGQPSSFIGMIGNDEYGRFYRNDLIKYKIAAYLIHSDTPTGNATAFVTPDSERTFATYLGAAVELSADHLADDAFMNCDILHIEGYLVQNQNLIRTAIQMARRMGKIISLDLASYNVVESNLSFLQELIQEGIDIIFANEEEAKAFTNQMPEDAVHSLSQLCEIAVVKIGKDGSLIKHKDELFRCTAVTANPIDTTGAGDLFAAGFLYGYANNLPLKACGDIGSLLAAKVIEVPGAGIPDHLWEDIINQLDPMSVNAYSK